MPRFSSTQFLLGMAMALLLGGCSAAQVSLAEQTEVPVHVLRRGAAKLVDVSAVRLDDGVVVKGKVERLFPSPIRGHVDVVVLDVTGRLVAEASADYFPHAIRGKGRQRAAFTVRLPGRLGEGARVQVAYHAKGAGGDPEAGCGENAATKDT